MKNIPTGAIDAIKYYRTCNPKSTLIEAKHFYDGYMASVGTTRVWENLTFRQIQTYMERCDNKSVARAAIETLVYDYNQKHSAYVYVAGWDDC